MASFLKKGPLAGVASTTSIDPAIVPQSVIEQLQVQPIPPEVTMAQTGERFSQGQLPDLPTETLYPVPEVGEGGPDINYEPRRMEFQDEQNIDVREQAERLAEATSQPDFTTPGGVMDILNKSREELGDAYTQQKVGEFQRKEFKDSQGNEARAISNLANSFQSKVLNNEGVFQNEQVLSLLENDLGLTPETVNNIGGIMTLALSSVGKDIRSRRYNRQVEGAPQEDIFASPEDFNPEEINFDEIFSKKSKRQGIEALPAITSSIDQQPVMRGFMQSFGTYAGQFSSRPATPGGTYQPRNVSPETSAALAYSAIEDGFFDIGIDKNGRYYPLITQKMEDLMAATTRMTSMYNAAGRLGDINEPIILSQSNPPVGLRYAGKLEMFNKGGEIINRNTDVTEAAMILMSSVGLVVDGHNYSLLSQMAQDVGANMAISDEFGNAVILNPNQPPPEGLTPGAYSTSVYAESIADLSKERFVEEYRQLSDKNNAPGKVSATIQGINGNKIQQVTKHIKEYLGTNLLRGARFTSWFKSDSTGRMFPTATDVNVVNHSGTIRPATSFAVKHVARIDGNIFQMLDSIKQISQRVYNTSGLSGIGIGQTIHERLVALSSEKLVLLDAMYQISKVAQDLGYLNMSRYGLRPTDGDYIEALTPEVLRNVASFGALAKGWSENGNLPTRDSGVSLPPALSGSLEKLFEKKEWGPRISNSIMAHEVVSTSKAGGGIVQLAATIETDASQSNASIMSLMIGDVDVSNILGNYVGGKEMDAMRSLYKDLRNKVASTIDDDVDLTFTGPDEVEAAEAIKGLFRQARGLDPAGFDKKYARGIVVAGLYGKHPLYMFTEVEDMLAKLGLPAQLRNLEETFYKGNRRKMLEDFASLYATSMKKHLANLQGYQQVMSAIGSIKAALNGSSRIKSFGNTEIDIGAHNVVPYDDETSVSRKALGDDTLGLPLFGVSRGLTAPGDFQRSITEIQDMKNRLAEINMDIEDYQQSLTDYTTYGDKARKTLPVVLVQSGDSFQMSSAVLYAHKGHKQSNPLNVQSIHDATITAPGSTLLLKNAYNNISPYLMAVNSKSIFEGLSESIEGDLVRAKARVRQLAAGAPEGVKEVVNIGRRGEFKALMGFFDRIYNGYQMVSRDLQRGRIPKGSPEETRDKSRREHNRTIINYAIASGWLPPIEMNRQARDNLKVTPKEWESLVRLMIEESGWLKKQEQPMFVRDAKGFRAHRNRVAMEKFIGKNKEMIHLMAENKNQIVNSR